MNKYVIYGIILICVLVAGCEQQITSFEECVAAGNPVMESYPRQCRAGDKTFTEEIDVEVAPPPDRHYCTEEEKAAEVCTLDYTPVCGDNGLTYSNACMACTMNQIDYYVEGECEETSSGIDKKYCETDDDCEIIYNVKYKGNCAASCFNKDAEVDDWCNQNIKFEPFHPDTSCKCINKQCVVSDPYRRLTIEQALAIAQDSECTEKGTLTDTYMYNEITKTWWIDLTMKPEFENELCFPACVIIEETETAEINWRCTGALPPE